MNCNLLCTYIPPRFRQLANRWKVFSFMLLVAFAASSKAYAQDLSVSGKVTATEDGLGIPGASIMLKGTSMGTTSDAEGNFTLKVADPQGTLIFSFIGYATQEVTIGDRSKIDVALAPDITQLGEVVVVGYGTVKKKDLTGCVGVIDPEQITKRGSISTMEAMQGQVAGVDISNTTGRAGAPFKIQIRGQQSLSGGNPLYVVDGVITDNIDFLNPQDIERVDILKDASSTAIYGSRGAYGVVIITTKQGASVKDQAVITYDGYVGVRKVARLPDFMPGDKWWNFRQDSFISDALVKGTPIPVNPGDNSKNSTELARRISEKDFTDWPSLLLRDGKQMNHWISMAGKGEKMGYTMGVGYQEEKGNVVHDDYKRYNFKVSIDHKMNDKFSGGGSMNLSYSENDKGSPNAILNAFRMSPVLSPYATETGALLIQPGKDIIDAGKPTEVKHIDMTSSVNPLVDMENSKQETRVVYAIGNVFLQYAPISWLSIKTSFSPRYTVKKDGEFLGSDTEGRVGGLAKATLRNNEKFSYIWDNQVNVNKTFGDHVLNAMALYSTNMFREDFSSIEADQLPKSSKSFYNVNQGPAANRITTGTFTRSTIVSYAIRLNYTFKNKYLLTLSNRWDGASVLAEGNQWASFPSAAVGWRISEENFLKDVNIIDDLKIRASYGQTGNNSNVKPYTTSANASTPAYYDFDGVSAGGLAPDRLPNKLLTWEKTTELDLGLDFSIVKARVTGTFDFYNKLSDGIQIERDLPLESGYPKILQNIGVIRNRGIEMALTTVNISTSQLTWQTTFNFAKNKNQIMELLSSDQDLVGNKWFIGKPINVNYTYVFDGIWQEGDRDVAKDAKYNQLPGQAKVVDFGDDGITTNDRRIIGSPMPSWTGGLTSSLNYKNFDLSASIYTRQGSQILSAFHQEFLSFEDRGRAKLNVDWYMSENPVTQTRLSNEYPQPKNAGRFWNNENVGFYRDVSFTKVKNITLGYTLPRGLINRAKIKTFRVYVNVLNPFVFTKYNGFDPEWADASYADGGVSSITYQMGVNVKF